MELKKKGRSLVYGPVASRRLGRSLGVDVVPFKVCDFDCVYCQLGRTTIHTLERKAYVSAGEILRQLKKKLRTGVRPDYITLGGSGEPTLNSALGDIIAAVRDVTDVPVAVLTNGSLFSDPNVRAACARAQLVLPDLDAGDEETFQRINRPCAGLTLEKVVRGLATFREEFSGQIWLEVFLVAGMNDSAEHVEKIRSLIERIRPDRIQLNTAVRPPAEEFVRKVSLERMEEIRELLGQKAEVIADFALPSEGEGVDLDKHPRAAEEDVLQMLRRRPCTVKDIEDGLGLDPEVAAKLVEELGREGKVRAVVRGSERYFFAGD
jgi:wyosine [tRNA(Phe)-imidazoG37] synthetase (radical SAM superfamily)